jgi:hypothetical protein
MLEVIAGTLLLLLGLQCFGQASRVRADYSVSPAPRSSPHAEMPTIINRTLGVLLVLGGMALLALAAFERVHAAGGVDLF